MKTKEKSWIQSLFAYADGEKKKMLLSVVLSVVSVTAGLVPFYCMYRIICLFVEETASAAGIAGWCLWHEPQAPVPPTGFEPVPPP